MEVMSVHTTSEVRALFQRSYEALKPHRRAPTPRSLQCASAVNDMMGMAVSYAIADQTFYNVTKPKVAIEQRVNESIRVFFNLAIGVIIDSLKTNLNLDRHHHHDLSSPSYFSENSH